MRRKRGNKKSNNWHDVLFQFHDEKPGAQSHSIPRKYRHGYLCSAS
jgi:hypothetical protein